VPDEDARFHFKSARGRPEVNPYVDKIAEYAPHAVTAEEAETHRGRWREAIGVGPDAPLVLEIGPGNGFFFRELCTRSPDTGHVAVEVRFKRVWLTAHKARAEGLDNFRVVHHHAAHLADLFAPGELDAVHANHPDPWPKDRHHKHRLLGPDFRRDLEGHLRPGGEIWIRSDFSPFGPLALELFASARWRKIAFTPDLHGGEGDVLRQHAPAGARFWAADIQTNYERKSLERGKTILLAGFARMGS
jgi:tRNA (guanine-N7-)-methyltransferase